MFSCKCRIKISHLFLIDITGSHLYKRSGIKEEGVGVDSRTLARVVGLKKKMSIRTDMNP